MFIVTLNRKMREHNKKEYYKVVFNKIMNLSKDAKRWIDCEHFITKIYGNECSFARQKPQDFFQLWCCLVKFITHGSQIKPFILG